MTTKYGHIDHKILIILAVIGQRYRNRLGWYEVLNTRGKGDRLEVWVKYDNETLPNQWIFWNMAYRIHKNMAKEDVQALPKPAENTTPYDKKNFGWTLGVIAKLGLLYAEIKEASQDGFKHDYVEATGSNPLNSEAVAIITNLERWGNTLRIYFPKTTVQQERFCLPGHLNVNEYEKDTCRVVVNNNEFWWHLVNRLGFKLGREQDKELIKSKLPEDIRSDFEAGLNVILA